MMLHQDDSTHQWVPGVYWDLIVTMDDSTNEHYSMFFVNEEGIKSSFTGVNDTIKSGGLFSSLYTDRGSRYWHTPEAGGEVDKRNPTQFGRTMHQLGIEMIPLRIGVEVSACLVPTRVDCHRSLLQQISQP